MKIEIVCNSSGIFGGVKRLYRLATYFNEAGHQAVVNMLDGSENVWFDHNVPENVQIDPDIRICPETCQRPIKSAKNIAYVQAQFDPIEHDFDQIITTTSYLKDHLQSQDTRVDRVIPYGFDSGIFTADPSRRVSGRIGIMPRKGKQEFDLIRGLMPNEDFLIIDNFNEEQTVKALQTCDYFFAISRCEGFGMPPFEAALCGCLVIGYHGKGAAEWLTPRTFVPCSFPQEFTIQLDLAKRGVYGNQRNALTQLVSSDLTLEKEKIAWLNVINDISLQNFAW